MLTLADAVERILGRLATNERLIVVVGPSDRWTPYVDQILARHRVETVLRRKGHAPNRSELASTLRGLADDSADVVLAIGGGATIDLAKLVAAFVRQPETVVDLPCTAWSVSHTGPKVAAIPTTAGSGSEATPFAVVYEDGHKYSISHPRLLPQYVELAPIACSQVPSPFANAAAGDVLAQALESSWATAATPSSRSLARAAFANAWQATESGLPSTPTQWTWLAHAAHDAGRAIAETRTTVCHALSYWLTDRLGVPHGQAVCATLPLFTALTVESVPDYRLPGELGIDPSNAVSMLVGKLRSLDLAPSLFELGVTQPSAIDKMVAAVNPERLSNYPVTLEHRTLRTLLEANADPSWERFEITSL